ncbi:MAG TPA: VOC family protein [Pseudonocardiaceae bacterium]|nr:VOC family protein [Pseudonocardiaceae bacterium]
MADRPWMKLSATVLDSADANALADFYHRLLGWPYGAAEPGWVTLRPADGSAGLSFAGEPDTYVRPTWPSDPAKQRQQMMAHLDIEVGDLAAGVAYALQCGATLAEFQPQQDVRVLLDPAGHPFCLWVRPPGD